MAAESSVEVRLLFEMLIRAMVDKPQDVSVLASPRDTGEILLKVSAAPRDIGKLIGRQGRTSRALRGVLSTISMAQRQRFLLDLDGASHALPSAGHLDFKSE
jgi:predicted RNA-binding protein YlqC (UPF0109 family)